MARIGITVPSRLYLLQGSTWHPAPGYPVGCDDSGSGADGLAVTIAVAAGDTGSAADAFTGAVAAQLGTTGTGSETIAYLVAALETDDAGTGSDALQIVIAATESGSGSDSLSTLVTGVSLIQNTVFTVTAITDS